MSTVKYVKSVKVNTNPNKIAGNISSGVRIKNNGMFSRVPRERLSDGIMEEGYRLKVNLK